jgi:hypothetical protein
MAMIWVKQWLPSPCGGRNCAQEREQQIGAAVGDDVGTDNEERIHRARSHRRRDRNTPTRKAIAGMTKTSPIKAEVLSGSDAATLVPRNTLQTTGKTKKISRKVGVPKALPNLLSKKDRKT